MALSVTFDARWLPDFYIGGRDNPQIERWFIIPRNKLANVYLHRILRSDEDRALHDHPWWNCSIVLRGGYWEVTPKGRKWRGAGSIVFRGAKASHRLEIDRTRAQRAVTLFLTGPRFRVWGFHCPKGWVQWTDFVDERDNGNVGRGCGEMS